MVYLDFYRIAYEGIFEPSLKVFKSREEAEKYIEGLKDKHGDHSDEYDIIETEVE